MKINKLILLFALLAFAISACSKEVEICDALGISHLNICVLGNSYSNDAFSYVPFILKEHGITCNIHIYYRGSGSLHDLSEQWYDAALTGLCDLDGRRHIRRHFSIDTRISTRWKKDSTMCANDILALEKWDLISLQQGGDRAKNPDSYIPYLQQVIHHVDSVCDYQHDLVWFMAYNAALQNSKPGTCEQNLATQKDIVENYPFDFVLPVATAVFNCQRTSALGMLGDSEYHRMYSSDNIHLQEGLPCYAAALAIVEAILQRYKPDCSVIGDKIRPTKNWIKLINSITPNGQSTGVDENNCILAQQIAVYANKYSFSLDFAE